MELTRVKKFSLRSLRPRFGLFTILVIGFLVPNIALFSVFFINSQLMVRKDLAELILTTVNQAAAVINVEEHETLKTFDDEQKEEYKRLRSLFQGFMKSNPKIRYVYTMRKTPDGEGLVYVVDGDPNTEEMGHIGDPYDEATEDMFIAFDKGPLIDREIAPDQYGVWFSGYAPLKDADGNTVAIVGADISAETLYASQRRVTLVGIYDLVVSLIILLIMSYMVSKSVVKPVRVLAEATKRMSQGDLTATVEIKSRNEIGQVLAPAYNKMLKNFQEIIHDVAMSAETLASASDKFSSYSERTGRVTQQVEAWIQEIADGAKTEADAVHKVSFALNDTVRAIERVNRISQEVMEASTGAIQTVLEGSRSVETSTQMIKSMQEKVSEASKLVIDLGGKSQEIGNISELISSIAKQTNLLALNAAIEASRAGEHGRGFAVVADEVRKLAEGSAAASKQIAELVLEIQQKTVKAAQSIKAGTEIMEPTVQSVIEAGTAFDNIDAAVKSVMSHTEEIKAASARMEEHCSSVVAAMNQADDITEMTSSSAEVVSGSAKEQTAMIEQVTASSRDLYILAENLKKIVSRFTVDSPSNQ